MTSESSGQLVAAPQSPLQSDRPGRAQLQLFWISFLILFFELTCIRWFGSTVIFLAFFTNLVLMACFLGMSVGLLASSRRADFIHATIPLALLAVAVATLALWGYHHFSQVIVDVGGQQSPQQVYFGTEARPKDPSSFIVPIEVVAGVAFVLIALVFVGPGQVMGRCLSAVPNRVAAYTTNIAGSLLGIVAFTAASYFRTPPLVWFGASLGIGWFFVKRWRAVQGIAATAVLIVLCLPVARLTNEERTVWSPYYKVQYSPRHTYVMANHIFHQGMLAVNQRGPMYTLPYDLNDDAGGPPFQDVLVIGAGSGNDVQAALAWGASHVDAVEIDPVIYEIGKGHHPERPYRDPRVTIHLDDGRSFVHRTQRRYDLVVYALVDSLVLHSGYSSLRLESFLFTEQAFRDIHAKLKPGGIFVMYNFYRQGWVLGRLVESARQVFDSEPIVLTTPYRDLIRPDDNLHGQMNFVLVAKGDPSSAVTRLALLRSKFDAAQFFWSCQSPRANAQVQQFGPARPELAGTRADDWFPVGPARVETAQIGPLPSDDWPFLYLREPVIPAMSARGMVIVACLSLALLLLLAPVRKVRPDGQMFFLGAGFMLLETKGVVNLALLFGSTWIVNSIVFVAILVMILLSNLYVLMIRPRRLWPYYGLLGASLLFNAFVPLSHYLQLSEAGRIVISCVVVFVPIFFAGVIFAVSFAATAQPDAAFGSNIAGALLGGLTEFLSVVAGFNSLLWIALAYYLLAAVFRHRLPDPA